MERLFEHVKTLWAKRLKVIRARRCTQEEKERSLSTSKQVILIVIRQNITSTGVCALFELLLASCNARVPRS
jgi:ribosomal protein L15E